MTSTVENFKLFFSETNSRKIFFILSGIIFLLMVFSSSQYGICWDELQMKEYGDNVFKFYTSFGKDKSYYDANGVMHFYGPFFDLIGSATTYNYSGDVYERRHFFIAVFGFAGIFFAGLTAKELGGWRLALLAQLFIFLTPVYFGHSMFNSKDIPFAGAYAAAIYFIIRIVKEFPSVPWTVVTGAIVSIGIALSIRIGGLLLFAYLGLFLLIKVIRSEPGTFVALLKNKKTILKLLVTIAGAYIFALLFWPYALTGPIKHPLEALGVFSKYNFDTTNLFNGQRPHYWELPWNYLPTWIYVTTPLFICVALIFIPLLIYKWKKFREVINADIFLMIMFTAVFPVFYIVITKANVYDGWRHVLFIYPSLVVCCAAIWYGLIYLIRTVTSLLKYIAVALLSLFMLEPAWFMAKHHKYETFYFSPAIGGVKGAFKKFDIDYYGTSLRYAVEWIAEHADSLEKGPNGKIRVRCFYGERISVEHFIKKYDNLEYVILPEASRDWDYSIIQPVQAKYDTAMLNNWPPRGMVHQIEIDGTPIVAIARNYNKDAQQNASSISIFDNNNITELINASLNFYNSGDFLNCIAASERTLIIDPKNYIAYNNAAAAFNSLHLYREGIEYSRKALEIKPDFNLATGNLNAALEAQKTSSSLDKNQLANNYLNLSLVYFNLRKFETCIAAANNVILLRPADAIAYNNICAAYNQLGQFDKAARACEKALAINPDFELAKNNLKAINESKKK